MTLFRTQHAHWAWLTLLCGAFLLYTNINASPKANTMHQSQIDSTMATIKNGHTVFARTNAANHLAQLTSGISPESVDDNTLNRMIALLDSSEESVRAGVAAALGNLGPRAKVAAPKLIAILPKDCPIAGLSSFGAIRLALQRIGVPAPPPRGLLNLCCVQSGLHRSSLALCQTGKRAPVSFRPSTAPATRLVRVSV